VRGAYVTVRISVFTFDEKKFPFLLARILSENMISCARMEQLKGYSWEAYLEMGIVYFEESSYYYLE
jgi:hypothetical protein